MVWDSDTHGASAEADQVNVPKPSLATLIPLPSGAGRPCTAANDSDVGFTRRIGGGFTVNVTGSDSVPNEPEIVIVAVYVPTAIPLGSAVAMTVAGALIDLGAIPLSGDTESHGASSEIEKSSVPPPEFHRPIGSSVTGSPSAFSPNRSKPSG